MTIWKYIILTDAGRIITRDPFFAEKKRKNGNIIFCKRESNIFRFNQ
jgi:hypothetical protein